MVMLLLLSSFNSKFRQIFPCLFFTIVFWLFLFMASSCSLKSYFAFDSDLFCYRLGLLSLLAFKGYLQVPHSSPWWPPWPPLGPATTAATASSRQLWELRVKKFCLHRILEDIPQGIFLLFPNQLLRIANTSRPLMWWTPKRQIDTKYTVLL